MIAVVRRGAGRVLRTLRRPWALVVLALFTLAAVGALSPLPASAEPDPDSGYAVTGFGDLLVMPDTPATGRTLYETYSITGFRFSTVNVGAQDIVNVALTGQANTVMFLTAAIVRGAIVIMWQMYRFDLLDGLVDALAPAVGTIATNLAGWMLPTALAIGAISAYARMRRGDGFNQVLWVLVGGVCAYAFAASPGTVLTTLVDARNVVASSVAMSTADAMATTSMPFEFSGEVYSSADPTETTLRKAADSVWRAYVVTPWCIAEFGSQEACTAYGKGLLDQGLSDGARTDWIKSSEAGHPGEYDSDGDTFRWISGKNAADRLGITYFALGVAAIFSVMLMLISFLSLMAFVSALLLFVMGAFFVILMVIPGRPRQIAGKWFEALVGLLIQSVAGALIISGVLLLTGFAFSLAGGVGGWATAAGLSIMIACAGFSMRRTVAGILGALAPGGGMTAILGAMAVRGMAVGAGRMIRGLGRGASGMAAAGGRNVKNRDKGAGNSLMDRLRWANGQRGARQAPPPTPRAELPPAPTRNALPAGAGRPAIDAPQRSGYMPKHGKYTTSRPARPHDTPWGRHQSRFTQRSGAGRQHRISGDGRYLAPSTGRVIEVGKDGAVRTIQERPTGVGDPHLRDNPPRSTRQPARPARSAEKTRTPPVRTTSRPSPQPAGQRSGARRTGGRRARPGRGDQQ